MVRIRNLALKHRLFARTYPWRTLDPVPVADRSKPLDDCRVALVSSAGLVAPHDPPFDIDVKGGDWSWRTIPSGADVQSLEEHHRSDAFDHSGIARDRNMGLPLDRLHELAERGIIGEVAPRHVSVMGSITAPARFQRDTVPEIVARLTGDHVDVALLVPV
jgi:D-proline reductase (dithiol) PrdB